MTAVTLDSLTGNRANMFRAANQAVLVRYRAPNTDATKVATLVNAQGLLAIPAGFKTLGLLREGEGVELTSSMEASEARSEGRKQATMRWAASEEITVTFTVQEVLRRIVQAITNNLADDFKVTETATGFSIRRGDVGDLAEWEVLVVALHGAGAEAVFNWFHLPLCELTSQGGRKFGVGQEAATQLTLSASLDEKLGYSINEGIEGPGLTAALRESLGFPSVTP